MHKEALVGSVVRMGAKAVGGVGSVAGRGAMLGAKGAWKAGKGVSKPFTGYVKRGKGGMGKTMRGVQVAGLGYGTYEAGSVASRQARAGVWKTPDMIKDPKAPTTPKMPATPKPVGTPTPMGR